MIILAFLALFASTPPSASLLNKASDFSVTQQSKCDQFLSWEMKHQESLSALICGRSLTTERNQIILKRSSLIHIFVVSGAHLIFLDYFLGILRIPVVVRFVIWGLFTVMAGWQPPVVRAFVQLTLRAGLRKFGVSIPSDFRVIASGLLCLGLFPQWRDSLSFQMSWCASSALSLESSLRQSSAVQRAVLIQAFIYISMAPLLFGFGSLHPLSIVFNLILGNFVAGALLPLAVASIPLSFLRPVFDFSMDIFLSLTEKLIHPVVQLDDSTLSRTWAWVWIITLQLFLWRFRIFKFRGKDNSR